MEHSFWKRILLLRKTTIPQSSSSSSTIFDGGESQTQIVQKGLTQKLNVPDNADNVSNDFSDCYSTASLASSGSSSSSITRCDFSEKTSWRCSRGRLWIACALISVILIVAIALTLTLTLVSAPSSPHGFNPLKNTVKSKDNPLPPDTSFELTEAESSSNAPDQYDSSSVNYMYTDDPPRSRDSNNGDDGRALELKLDTLSSKGRNRTESGQSQERLRKVDLKKLSRQSWEFLNRNKPSSQKPNSNFINKNRDNSELSSGVVSNSADEPTSTGVVLPALMVYTSDGAPSNGQVSNLFSLKTKNISKKSCCRTQKYIQTVKLDGCEPLKILNRMCSGQCVSVWIPGVFSSFPVCQPSRSHWKVLTLKCGLHRDKKKRVRIEKVRRCSCMEAAKNIP